MTQIHVFTSAAFNYIPKVRLLFQSIKKYHPDWHLHLLLADEPNASLDLSSEPFDELVSVSDLDIPFWRGWAFCHSIVELATAIKPFMLARLLARADCKKVIYLDPDTVLFSRLDDILHALDEANIVLTPHQTIPEQSLSAVIDNEICSLKHGIYNLGFIAVAATDTGKAFADWWKQRVYHFCRADIANGLFTDQRWIDLVPAFFDQVAIMRSPRHNVSTWNLTTRYLSQDVDGAYMVDGEPLGFYHFTGFDSGAHKVMAAKNAGNNPAVFNLINWYQGETAKLAEDPLAKVKWSYLTFSNGEKIERECRIIYRERVDLQQAFPDPFNDTGYFDWWKTQAPVEYPELFSSTSSSGSYKLLSSQLTPGFRGGNAYFDWSKLRQLVQVSLKSPSKMFEFGRRGWEVLISEGAKGLKRRLLS